MEPLDVALYEATQRRSRSPRPQKARSWVGHVKDWGRGSAERFKTAVSRRSRRSLQDGGAPGKLRVPRRSSFTSFGFSWTADRRAATERRDFQVFIYPKAVRGLPPELGGEKVRLLWMGEVGGRGAVVGGDGAVRWENVVLGSRVALSCRQQALTGSRLQPQPQKLHVVLKSTYRSNPHCVIDVSQVCRPGGTEELDLALPLKNTQGRGVIELHISSYPAKPQPSGQDGPGDGPLPGEPELPRIETIDFLDEDDALESYKRLYHGKTRLRQKLEGLLAPSAGHHSPADPMGGVINRRETASEAPSLATALSNNRLEEGPSLWPGRAPPRSRSLPILHPSVECIAGSPQPPATPGRNRHTATLPRGHGSPSQSSPAGAGAAEAPEPTTAPPAARTAPVPWLPCSIGLGDPRHEEDLPCMPGIMEMLLGQWVSLFS